VGWLLLTPWVPVVQRARVCASCADEAIANAWLLTPTDAAAAVE
jgi:hypothetical protein